MSEFEAVLRRRVATVREELSAAQRAGDEYEADLHGARLRELLDLASRNEVDVASLDVGIPRQRRH